ncbi:MAG: hypothetical protein WAL56_13795 [Candidatus Sulfotelmatobacter sp.]
MACPFFMPVEKLGNEEWLHAQRLPLGSGWTGHCTAPGHENTVPSPEQLRDFCNLGYAENCGRLPRERLWDSVRFGARTVPNNEKSATHVHIRFVCERNHLPVEHGTLKFDAATSLCEQKHSDGRVQRMAECFLASYIEKRERYIEKRKKPQTEPAIAS